MIKTLLSTRKSTYHVGFDINIKVSFKKMKIEGDLLQ
jgi:hypothetical protein